MSRTPTPRETHRVQLTATVAPETMVAIAALQKPGEGKGQVVDRAIEALKKGERV